MARSAAETPVMKQFWEAKKAHPDTLMLFRMGDFYETFDRDAILASDILGITLTKRANGAASSVPLAGFPHHSLEQHLHKLLRAGHRVAICEQVEDPKLAKGIVKREVVEVVTPGTSLSDKYLDQKENNYLASIVLDKTEFGLAILDHSTGEFMTGQWKREDLLNLLKQFNPAEIIIPENQESELKAIPGLRSYFITHFADWQAEYSTGYENLTEHFTTKNLKGFGIEDLPLAIRAAGASLYYVSQNFKGRVNHITSVSMINDSGVMGLDAFTVRNLEVFKSLATQGVHGTLVSIMDNAVTAMGSRLLKRWLSRPLSDKRKIEDRLEKIQEFYNDSHLRDDVRGILKNSADLDRIIARLSTGRATPRDAVHLGETLKKLDLITASFGDNEPGLKSMLTEKAGVSKVIEQIDLTLVEDPPLNPAKGGYIKPGFSEELDEYRGLSENANDWLVKYQLELQQSSGINSLKVGYNRVFGYYLEVTKTHQDRVPENFIRKQTLVNAERYFTVELKEYEEKILKADEKIQQLESAFFRELSSLILESANLIQQNAELLSRIDIAAGLAALAQKNGYIRPKITIDSSIELKESRHPVVEQLLPVGEIFIPNDVYLDCTEKQIGIITGPNMAGKSTYLRQVGLLVLMAQVGSFIPAESATIGIVDKLFTRVGASDNLAGGESTFLVEMNETANILNNTTDKSLILLDEIGRGTSTYDGLSIAWAVVEYLHNQDKVAAKTLFATHYHELVELADQLPRAFNLNVAVKEFGNRVIFIRKILSGGADKSYGVHVAEMAGLPKSIIQRSHEILSNLMSRGDNELNVSLEVKQTSQVDLFQEQEKMLRDELDEIDINTLTPLEALTKLNEIKKKYEL